MRAARIRIGRVRLRDGATLRILPGGKDRTTEHVFKQLNVVIGHTRDLFAKDLGGFVLIPWDHNGAHNAFVCSHTAHPNLNDLPSWVAEAIRRDNAERDVRQLLMI